MEVELVADAPLVGLQHVAPPAHAPDDLGGDGADAEVGPVDAETFDAMAETSGDLLRSAGLAVTHAADGGAALDLARVQVGNAGRAGRFATGAYVWREAVQAEEVR